MLTIPASRRLIDLHPHRIAPFDEKSAGQQSDALTQEHLDAAVAQAFEQGRAAGRKQAEAAFFAQKDADDVARKLEEEQRLAVAIDRLWARTQQDLERMTSNLARDVVRIMKPLLTERLMAESMSELVGELSKLIEEAATQADVRVEGPASLLAALRSVMRQRCDGFTFTENDQPELSVSIGDAQIETRIGEWLGLLETIP